MQNCGITLIIKLSEVELMIEQSNTNMNVELSSQQGSIHSFQTYDTVFSPVHYLDCWCFTLTFLYRWKTNSQESVLDSTQCRIHLETVDRSLLSSTFISLLHKATCLAMLRKTISILHCKGCCTKQYVPCNLQLMLIVGGSVSPKHLR